MRLRITQPNPVRLRRLRWSARAFAVAAVLVLCTGTPASAADPTPEPASPAATALTRLIDELDRLIHAAQTPPAPTPSPVAVWQRTCDTDSGVAELVVRRFYCNARDLGATHDTAMRVATEALVVAHCESGLDPNVVVFDGRYLDQPHPGTGFRYSAAGVFQFIRATADGWIEGGYANVTDARANIDAATRLYWHNVYRGHFGWADWACAAANDGFRHTSVLGEPVPGWVHQTVWATVGHLPPYPG